MKTNEMERDDVLQVQNEMSKMLRVWSRTVTNMRNTCWEGVMKATPYEIV